MTATERFNAPSPHSLACSVDAHLRKIGFSRNRDGYFVPGDLSKDTIRKLHSAQRAELLHKNRQFIDAYSHALSAHFATGRQIQADQIAPELVEVHPESLESKLFRFACYLWSVPVSQGFGRRLRFLVRDRQNDKLIGLFALGDPVFNLSARDSWIGWTGKERSTKLVHVMDGYVVGAVPPYSQLIAGKLVAALMGSTEVRRVYERKYLGTEGVISKKENRARLVLLTTTSALGRSSLYNRLKIPNGPRFHRIGVTKGFGHFHLSHTLFEKMRAYLKARGHPYESGHRFGTGPNWKLRVARAALDDIGLDGKNILKHGIEREVYAVPLAHNWKAILLGEHRNIRALKLTADEIAEYCLSRWILPRAERDKRYKMFDRRRIVDFLSNGQAKPSW